MKIAVIGGGAAGFFSALAVKENFPFAEVVIFEKLQRVLYKVKISGGGRCNVTHACSTVDELCDGYPRGGRNLKKIFHVFNNNDVMSWFEVRGVPLVIQDDGCVFPASQSSSSIIDCFYRETKRMGIEIRKGAGIKAVRPVENSLEVIFEKDGSSPLIFDKVIVTTGGSPRKSGLLWLENLGHEISDPVPSLFTFNMPDEPVTCLMGVVVENTMVSIQGTNLKSEGPLLITHWGMSGPAVINLSSYGARILHEKGYDFKIQVNWVNERNNDTVSNELKCIAAIHTDKIISNYRPYALPARLWNYLVEKCGLSGKMTWGGLGRKGMNQLSSVLTNDVYSVKGQTTFREEFVTCGGVSLGSIDMKTMQSRVCRNLYFAGEILDIDGITGGYNFQCAWTTGFIAAKLK
ncbi:MAG TPA: NAD(P)/FAD-dependent oxidoreductase [Bacteroidales bacterium]|nr:NAD(P)/FAD-dependent oxidoreductase [Bacteroidales bacterium]